MNRKAFTLVEVLVCAAIIAILISLVYGAIATYRSDKPEAVGPGKPYLVEEDEPPVAEAPPAAQGSVVLTRGYPIRITVDNQHYTLLAPKGGGEPTIEPE